VRGTVRPYVPGQRAVVRFYRGSKRLAVREVAIRQVPGTESGTFLVGFSTRGQGRVTVRATHRETPQQATLVANAKHVDVVRASSRPGSRGYGVRVLQRRLDDLGYVVGRRGHYDGRTARAVLAFRKVNGMARVTTADSAVTRRVLDGRGAFKPRYRSHGRHVEADLSRQVLALIDPGGKVVATHHTASGAPATPTIRGSFRFYRKDFGRNALGMVHSSYFIRGYAIHGYPSVPTGPASHGCLRVPIPEALGIFRWIRHGNRIDVYA
jgi:hypothetical protein